MKSSNIILICVLILVSTFSISCKKKNKQSIEVVPINFAGSIDDLKKLVLIKGDTMAYHTLVYNFMHTKYSEENLIYSLIMANKYKYKPAFYDVYVFLTNAYKNHKKPIDETSKKLALKYLKKGADLNDVAAIREFNILYNNGIYDTKDTVLSRKFEEKIDKSN